MRKTLLCKSTKPSLPGSPCQCRCYGIAPHGITAAAIAAVSLPSVHHTGAARSNSNNNQAAMATLNFNKHNHEYARWALDSIEELRTLSWQISITWYPSHCNIRGNERADALAKQGADNSVPCRFALTTKTWLLMQERAQFTERWKTQLPLSTPSFTFSKHLQEVEWADTRALWWSFATVHQPTHPPTSLLTPAHAAWTSSPHTTSSGNANC